MSPMNIEATHAERDSDELVQALWGEDSEAPGLCLAVGGRPVGSLQHLLKCGPAAGGMLLKLPCLGMGGGSGSRRHYVQAVQPAAFDRSCIAVQDAGR